MQRAIAFGIALMIGASAFAQAPLPAPPGGAGYFGAPANQPFTDKTVFVPPATPPAPSAVLPGVEAAGGGLLPKLPKYWSGSADLGLNGSSGNSEVLNIRTSVNARRKTDANIFTTDFIYTLSQQGELTNTNQAIYNARDEILFGTSPWSLYASTLVEYDELRDLNFRVGVYGGASYRVIDDDDVTFKVRAGAGALREIGGPKDRWVPELAFGFDYKYHLNDRNSFLAILDYYPRVDDFGKYRIRARAAYENVIDKENCIILRLGIQDRYDSDPGTSKRNDLSYFATLGVKF